MLIWPPKLSEKTVLPGSLVVSTVSFTSAVIWSSGELVKPAALRISPPESSMKKFFAGSTTVKL